MSIEDAMKYHFPNVEVAFMFYNWWYIKYLNDCHNHTLVDEKYLGILPAYRKITDYDKFQMDNMRKVGIWTTHVFELFAHQAGGYDKVGFRQRDMYNEVAKDKRSDLSDAGVALEFLATMSCSDEMLFWRHNIDENGRLQHLFWYDGVCRKDYAVFDDVLAFDATYKKNMYLCPLVVFFWSKPPQSKYCVCKCHS
ncbi:protein FAR1-RELATED SEQUENCE 5-like [Vicia villosa]|uniref:protein FAR1-RELATED SEQUENCE 5-like n=1 Tax=Vicia villosa TaxID=3911 RepID=UPI00273C0133|nr:protein FAR1-RELATED SEQUENCE 5-like [Vicia villosa]